MTVIKKLQSKTPAPKEALKKEEPSQKERVEKSSSRSTGDSRSKLDLKTKKVCQFCETKNVPYYWDVVGLRRFMSDRGRISSSQRTGVCSKHQRKVSREIKRARHLALLPFTVKV